MGDAFGPVSRREGTVGWMPRFRLLLAALVAVVAVSVAAVGVQTVGAPVARAATCGPVACPSLGDIGCALLPAGCVAGTAIGAVDSQLGDAVASLAQAFMTAMIKTVADAVTAVLGDVSKFMTSSTRPDVTASSFVGAGGPYHQVAQLAAVLMILFLLFAVIQGTLTGQPGEMVARFARSVPLAVLAIVGLPWAVDQLLSLVDAACAWLLPTGATFTTIAKVYGADQVQAVAGFGIPVLLTEIFVWLGGLLIYAELVVRDALVLVAVALAPLSFAAMVWPAARHMARKVAELLAAVILSKLAIWIALLVGIDLFKTQATAPGADAWGQMIAGAAVLAVACFAPFVVWRLLPIAEAAVIAQGLSRQPGRTAQQAMYVTNSTQNLFSRFGRGGGGGGGGSHPSQSSSAPSELPSRSLGAPAGGGSPGGGSGSVPSGGGGGSGAAPATGAAGSTGAAGGSGASAGTAAGGAAAAGPAAAVAVPVAVAAAAKNKATGSAAAQTGNGSSADASSSGWGFTGNGGQK